MCCFPTHMNLAILLQTIWLPLPLSRFQDYMQSWESAWVLQVQRESLPAHFVWLLPLSQWSMKGHPGHLVLMRHESQARHAIFLPGSADSHDISLMMQAELQLRRVSIWAGSEAAPAAESHETYIQVHLPYPSVMALGSRSMVSQQQLDMCTKLACCARRFS